MKKLLFISICLLSLACQPNKDQSITTFILVRHAEKVISDDTNPDLTEQGKARAIRLSELLTDASVEVIYSSNFTRTIETVKPLANKLDLAIEKYNPGSKGYISDIFKKHVGKTILVSGHSNTVPFAVNELIGQEKYSELDHEEYGKIFFVTIVGKGKGNAIVLTY